MKHTSPLRKRPDSFELRKDHPLARGLVFAGLGRTSRSLTYRDSSGRGNHGLLTNMDVPATATSGWAWDNFLGRWVTNHITDDYITMGGGRFPFLKTTPFSGCSWIKTTANTGAIVSNWNFNITAGWNWSVGEFANGKLSLLFTSSGGTNYFGADTSNSVNTGAWTHVGFTYDGSATAAGIKLFINGAIAATSPHTLGTRDPGTLVDTAFLVGSRRGNNNLAVLFSGGLTDELIFNRALSDVEIQPLRDPSNVMLSGLLLPPRRRSFKASAAAPATNRRRRLLITGACR
jgi:hypothetical protein